MRPRYHRDSEVSRLRAELELTGFPRLKMLLLVGLTGGAGFLASYALLHFGMNSMAVRYPIAIGIAYLVFLFLLWLWLRTSAEDYIDLPDLAGVTLPGRNASASCAGQPSDAPDDGGAVSETIGAAAGADEFAIPLVILLMVGALLLSSLWVVYSAPVLFAELLVDGVLSASLYRRLRGLETRHWLETAVRRTIWPFVITVAVAWLGGMALQSYYPAAHSLGEVVRSYQAGGA